MIALLAELPALFAQEGPSNSMWQLLLTFLPVLPLVYFLMIMPQQQQEKKLGMLKGNGRVHCAEAVSG